MRVLVLGSSNPWRMESGIARALRRMKHDVLLLDDRRLRRRIGARLTQRWLLHRAHRHDPELVIVGKALGAELETLERILRWRRSAMWYLDAPWFQFPDRPDVRHIMAVGRMVDTFFVNGFVERWTEVGMNAKFLPAGADSEIRPVPPEHALVSDAAFIGTGYDPRRADVLLALAKHVRVRVWGKGWEQWRDRLVWSGRPVEGAEFARVCSSAAVVLGINPEMMKDATNSASNRMWITTLAGGFYLGQATPGITRLMLDGVHCSWWRDIDDLIAKTRHYISRPDERMRIRSRGEKFVRAHHTFDQRAMNIVEDREFVNPLGA